MPQLYKGGKQYTQDDLRLVFNKASFSSWEELVMWLEENGRPLEELDDAKVGEMIFDFKRIRDQEYSFTNDYKEAFNLTQL